MSWDHRSKPCTSTSGREEMHVRCENSPFFSVCTFSRCRNVHSSLLAALIDEIPVGCKRRDIIYLWCGLTDRGDCSREGTLLGLCSSAAPGTGSPGFPGKPKSTGSSPGEAISPNDKLHLNSSFRLLLCCQNSPQAGLGKGEVVGQGQLEPTAVEGF